MPSRAGSPILLVGSLLSTAVLLICFAPRASAEPVVWTVRLSAGGALNLPTHLAVEQEGEPEIRLTARYDTRAFEPPIYYSLRLAREDARGAWEIELVHQKLRLRRPPPEIERFEISHGYNFLLLGRSWSGHPAVLHLGAGPVIAHPETTVRGRTIPPGEGILGEGYYLSGFGLQVAAERKSRLVAGFRLAAEAKLSIAWARVPIADGRASVPNAAFHALAGIERAF
ncbi:MAG: hypothetical protein FJY73_03255 [Candidatus Eisenbacteria bacterium]|nr:hypothetical protein [Candidatus Eisenbacteria bacterium]